VWSPTTVGLIGLLTVQRRFRPTSLVLISWPSCVATYRSNSHLIDSLKVRCEMIMLWFIIILGLTGLDSLHYTILFTMYTNLTRGHPYNRLPEHITYFTFVTMWAWYAELKCYLLAYLLTCLLHILCRQCVINHINPLTPTVAIWGTAIGLKHPVPDQVKLLFVNFDIRALWRSGLSVRVLGCQKLQMNA